MPSKPAKCCIKFCVTCNITTSYARKIQMYMGKSPGSPVEGSKETLWPATVFSPPMHWQRSLCRGRCPSQYNSQEQARASPTAAADKAVLPPHKFSLLTPGGVRLQKPVHRSKQCWEVCQKPVIEIKQSQICFHLCYFSTTNHTPLTIATLDPVSDHLVLSARYSYLWNVFQDPFHTPLEDWWTGTNPER